MIITSTVATTNSNGLQNPAPDEFRGLPFHIVAFCISDRDWNSFPKCHCFPLPEIPSTKPRRLRRFTPKGHQIAAGNTVCSDIDSLMQRQCNAVYRSDDGNSRAPEKSLHRQPTDSSSASTQSRNSARHPQDFLIAATSAHTLPPRSEALQASTLLAHHTTTTWLSLFTFSSSFFFLLYQESEVWVKKWVTMIGSFIYKLKFIGKISEWKEVNKI